MRLFSSLSDDRNRSLAAFLTLSALVATTQRYVPHRLPRLPAEVDLGVVLLFAPLCALICAIVVVTLHLLAHGSLPENAPPLVPAIPHPQIGDDI